jgi:GH24 family phage-related lysozyme (muramidase)
MEESPRSETQFMSRAINQAGLDLIKEFEGFRASAYRCPAGVPTIGYGHTKTARMGMLINRKHGEQLLRSDLSDAESAVSRLVKVPLTDNEFSALVSFVFNLGEGNFAKSTLLRKLNAGDRQGAADELLRWNRAGGRVLRGLIRRREAERQLFLRADDD